jgi:putative hemolysin
MGSITTEIIVILLLIAANGLLALGEMAVVSARKARLLKRIEEGDPGARIALEMAKQPTRFFSSIQIGITLIGVLSGAFGGATLAEAIADRLARIPWIAPYGEAIGIGIVVLGITYLTLVLGELVPKRLAQNNAERIASRIARPLAALSRLGSPIVGLLSASTELVLRLLGAETPKTPSVTEEEIKLMFQEGTEIGIFNLVESDMIKRVLRLADRRVSTMMTHRTEVEWLDAEDPLDSLHHKIVSTQHARLPVGRGNLDELLGILEAKEYLALCLKAMPVEIEPLLKDALFIPEAMTALEVLDKFKQTRNHLAIVVDEFGGVIGIITPTDVLEAIVGGLPDTDEREEPRALQREDGSWLLDGAIPVDEVKDLLALITLPEEEYGNYETLGGLMMERLGRIPVSGDHFDWSGLRFEVVDMDGRRVDKVLVSGISQ